MKNRFISITVVFVCVMSTCGMSQKPKYTHDMFVRALRRDGMILIKLRAASSCFKGEVCTSEVGLISAIHLQYGLDFGETGRGKAWKIALASTNRDFAFSKKRAFDTVKPDYTCRQLDEVRHQLADIPRSELITQLKQIDSDLHKLYMDRGKFSYRDAVAHVLIERGVEVRIDDLTAMLQPL
jgi:hypothetical protein